MKDESEGIWGQGIKLRERRKVESEGIWGQEIKLRGRGMVKVKGFRAKGSSYEEEEWGK